MNSKGEFTRIISRIDNHKNYHANSLKDRHSQGLYLKDQYVQGLPYQISRGLPFTKGSSQGLSYQILKFIHKDLITASKIIVVNKLQGFHNNLQGTNNLQWEIFVEEQENYQGRNLQQRKQKKRRKRKDKGNTTVGIQLVTLQLDLHLLYKWSIGIRWVQ